MTPRALNFGAGPSTLPEEVLREAGEALLNFEDTGIGIAEISHRSKVFENYIRGVESDIRKLLKVPDSHVILFTQGGGCAQFSAVVLNMLALHHERYPALTSEQRTMDYVVTGSWSDKAAKEAKRLGGAELNVVVDSRKFLEQGKFDNIPSHKNDTYKFSENPVLIYYCANETVAGVEFAREEGRETSFPFHLLPENPPLVGDYSSSFMSHPIPRLADHAIIYAGAQKNLGPAGLTIVIVRKDCLVDVDKAARSGAIPVPMCTAYRTLADNHSLYNTPPVLSIYITGLVLKRMVCEFGDAAMESYAQFSTNKSNKVYHALDKGMQRGVFRRKVREGSGSQMNIVFDVVGDGKLDQFIAGAEARNMKGLRGHRSVGGVRVSLYNAVTESNVQALVDYMMDFVEANSNVNAIDSINT
ncbi:pyridoxal phosphate-dependent transferase [Scleroderma yunnanense]